ncbi:hypothetical protein WG66_004310 [Moniliophthora roreri]|nr:hypothetical protein WG66_004310 [Moniliophthora roreri]
MPTAGNMQRLRWDDLPQDQLDKLAEGNVRKILHTVKSFDEDEPDTLQAWLDVLEIQFKMAGLIEGASKIYSAMWKMSYKLRTELQGSSKAKGNFWEDFKKLLFKEFPDLADTDNGLMDKLYWIVLHSQYIGFGGLEKLKKYNRAFLLEVRKLLKPPALLSNHTAVQTYLSAFETTFKIQQFLRKHNPLYRVKAAQGQAPSQAATTPVIKQEETVPSLFPKKEEQDSDIYNLGVAATVDVHQCTIQAQTQEIENLKRQMSSLLGALATQKPLSQGTLMFTMNQDVQGKHGQPMIGRAVQSTSAGQICYWCGKQGHMVRECPSHKQIVNDGWLVWNESANHYILKDGKRLPKREGTEFWKDKVTEYAKTKGWVTSVDFYFFSGIEEEDEQPNVFHAATKTAPVFEENTLQQLVAAMLQQLQLNAAQTEVTKN